MKSGLQRLASGLGHNSEEPVPDFECKMDEMIENVRRAELNAERHDWSPRRWAVAGLLESRPYELFTNVVIVANTVLIIIDADQRAESKSASGWVVAMNYVFLVIYTIDLILRLFVHRTSFFQGSWNCLDFLVVVSDYFSEILTAIVGGNVPSLSVLRVMRVFRLLRVGRVLRMFRELEMMLSGFMSAMRAMVWASIMVIVMTTVFSVVAVEVLWPVNKRLAERGVWDGCERCGRAYESVWSSFNTFLQQILAGDSWGTVSLPIIEEEPWTILVFFTILVSINMGLLNLILTVIVDVAAAARASDEMRALTEKAKDYSKAKRSLFELCKEMDLDGSGTLTQDELMDGMDTNAKFTAAMALLDICKDDMHVIFNVMDEDGSGCVSYKEFVDQLYKVRNQDERTMLIYIKGYVCSVRSNMQSSLRALSESVGDEIAGLARQVDRLCAVVCGDGDPHISPIEVCLHSAHDVELSDEFGGRVSEAFCTCEVIGKPEDKLQTKAVRGVPDPLWRFTGALERYVQGEDLLVSVWARSEGRERDHLLGQTILAGREIADCEGRFNGEVHCKGNGDTPITVNISVTSKAVARSDEAPLLRPRDDGAARLATLERDLGQLRAEMRDDLARVADQLSTKADSHTAMLSALSKPSAERNASGRLFPTCGEVEQAGTRSRC